MSEADNAWLVEAGGRQHQVEVEHTSMTGKIQVKVGGEQVADDRMRFREKEVSFDLDGANVVVNVDWANAGLSARSALHVDGRFVEPMRR